MAITFKEKSNLGKNAAILAVFVAIFCAIIFFAWRFLQESRATVPDIMAPMMVSVDVQALQDPRLAEMDTFPKIAPLELESPRQNPFAEAPAAATEHISGEEL